MGLRSLAACSVTLLILSTGCTPDGPAPPSPAGTVEASTDAPSATRSSSDPAATGSVQLEELGEDDYPTTVGGFTLNWLLGQPVYDAGKSDRIVVAPWAWSERAAEWSEGLENGQTELRPGVWCYEANDAQWCVGNSESGRLFLNRDMFDTLTLEELAAWTESFVAEVP